MSQLLDKTQIAEIKKIIAGYRPSPEVLEQFRMSDFAIIAGPVAAGKDTLRNALVADDKYLPVLSSTTRPKREGETDGQTYHFTTYGEMKKGLAAGQYFQVALVHNQQVSGLHISEINKLKFGKIGLSILIVRIEKKLRAMNPDIKTVFLVPPSLDEMLRRINKTRSISEEETNRRLAAAKQEVSDAMNGPNYYCLVSDGYERVRKLADEFLRTGKRDQPTDTEARACAKQLLQELENHK